MKTKPLNDYQVAQLFSVLAKRGLSVELHILPDCSLDLTTTDRTRVIEALATEIVERGRAENGELNDHGLELQYILEQVSGRGHELSLVLLWIAFGLCVLVGQLFLWHAFGLHFFQSSYPFLT